LALVAVLQIACGSKPDSPEARVRALIKKAEVAAEQKDLGTFRDIISDQYLDEFRQDKQVTLGILSFHFFRNQSIYLLTRIQAITFPEPARAEAVVFVATAGQPIRGTEELVALRADLFKFDVTLAAKGKGDWKVTRAQWRRVELKDFL
jgi:hypothetical protein